MKIISIRHAREARHLRVVDPDRPVTRGDCVNGPRPCPWVSCRYHLYLDVRVSGSIKFNHPDIESHEMGESCALDVADQGGMTLEVVSRLLKLTRERVRQIEWKGVRKVRRTSAERFEDWREG